jgi:hypothetical protein
MEYCAFYPEDKPEPAECGEAVLVWGDHFGAADVAEKLAVDGKRVTIVTESEDFAAWMEPCHKDVMMKRFAGGNGEGLTDGPFQHPVTIIPSTTIVEIGDEGEVTLMNQQFQKSTVSADNIILATVKPEGALYEQLLEAGIVVMKIGDARQVRNLRAAVTEGANAGLTLDQGLTLNANRSMISRLPTEVELA